jgi:exodeoxyribonuclease VII small subunit
MSKQKSYKELKAELDKVVSQMQQEDVDIDLVIELYKKGQALIKELENYLKNAENTVKAIKTKFTKKK